MTRRASEDRFVLLHTLDFVAFYLSCTGIKCIKRYKNPPQLHCEDCLVFGLHSDDKRGHTLALLDRRNAESKVDVLLI